MSTLRHIPDAPKRLIAHAAAERHGVLDEALVLTRAECEDIVQRGLAGPKLLTEQYLQDPETNVLAIN